MKIGTAVYTPCEYEYVQKLFKGRNGILIKNGNPDFIYFDFDTKEIEFHEIKSHTAPITIVQKECCNLLNSNGYKAYIHRETFSEYKNRIKTKQKNRRLQNVLEFRSNTNNIEHLMSKLNKSMKELSEILQNLKSR